MKRRKIVWTEFSKRDRKSLTKEGGGLFKGAKGVATAGSSLKAKGGPRRGCSPGRVPRRRQEIFGAAFENLAREYRK